VPFDLIGHSSFGFDGRRLDPAIARAILKKELPAAVIDARSIHDR
jgi:hypothetical protein